MNILRANLKHLYQRRAMWLWYFIIFCQFPLLILPVCSAEFERFLGYVVLSFFWGLLTAGLQKEILSKPLSFCLPGHRKIPRQFIFRTGFVVNGLLGLVFLAYPGLDFPYVLVVAAGGAFVGMVFYLLGVCGGFGNTNRNPYIGLFPFVIFGSVFFEGDRILQQMIVSSPVQIIIVSALISWLFWVWLGREELARQYCGKISPVVFDGWDYAKMKKFRQAEVVRRLEKKRTPFPGTVENFFQRRMSQHNFLSRGKCAWGHLYIMLGECLSILQVGPLAMGFVVLVIIFGYISKDSVALSNMLFIMPIIGAFQLDLLPYRGILLPASRSDKYYGAITSGFVISVVATVLLAMVSILSVQLEHILPDITLKGYTFSYHAMNIRYCFVTLSLMPIGFAIATLIRRRQVLKVILSIVLMYACLGFYVVAMIREIQFKPFILPVLMMIGWGISLLVLRYICMRRCLAGGGSRGA
ncbi:MAG: hypothetical protein ACYS6I_00855 [Planctomycetota bacterium]|jgi:hypothetical protein